MTSVIDAPQFTPEIAERIAAQIFGIAGKASLLPSERDQNFRIDAPDKGSFVLKIANSRESREMLEAENAAMAYLASTGLVPRVVGDLAGQNVSSFESHLVRLITLLPGSAMGNVSRHSDALLTSLGRAVGRVGRELGRFDHPALHRSFYWDLARAMPSIEEHRSKVTDARLQKAVATAVVVYRADVAPRLSRLRKGIVHGDANDFNVLVDPAAQRVTGLVDFGDMVFSHTVNDAAIAMTYAALDKDDPLGAAATVAAGYHAENPLTEEEIAALFGLMLTRLALSVCIAGHQQSLKPGSDYLGISQAAISRTFPMLAAIDPGLAHARLREACGLASKTTKHRPTTELLADRRRLFGRNLSVAYGDRPLHVVRGWMQYLFDESGRRYIDAYNNVPHVGHSHPRVTEAVAAQMATLNTNTRYLQELPIQFASELVARLPQPLEVCFFTASGSEANELALRLARAHTRRRDLIVMEAAYHGHTTTMVDVSPYKHGGPGGEGAPPWVHVAAVPDVYRGEFKAADPEAGRKYARQVEVIVDRLAADGIGLCGFLAETCPSVGGQIMLPAGYLEAVYRAVRAAGGVCIADEVQTGFGRIGTHFWAFEAHNVVPDIVVLGKPIANGYPMGAVITTREIADSFDNGMEFFSTFGGSTAACAAGLATLRTTIDEGLQDHAREVGDHLLGALRALQTKRALIGDVRGSGLFVGVELVRDRSTLEPATKEASAVVQQMRDLGVLTGTDGPHHNVIKLRGPMPLTQDDADMVVDALRRSINELLT